METFHVKVIRCGVPTSLAFDSPLVGGLVARLVARSGWAQRTGARDVRAMREAAVTNPRVVRSAFLEIVGAARPLALDEALRSCPCGGPGDLAVRWVRDWALSVSHGRPPPDDLAHVYLDVSSIEPPDGVPRIRNHEFEAASGWRANRFALRLLADASDGEKNPVMARHPLDELTGRDFTAPEAEVPEALLLHSRKVPDDDGAGTADAVDVEFLTTAELAAPLEEEPEYSSYARG